MKFNRNGLLRENLYIVLGMFLIMISLYATGLNPMKIFTSRSSEAQEYIEPGYVKCIEPGYVIGSCRHENDNGKCTLLSPRGDAVCFDSDSQSCDPDQTDGSVRCRCKSGFRWRSGGYGDLKYYLCLRTNSHDVADDPDYLPLASQNITCP